KSFMKWFAMAALVAVMISTTGLAQGRRRDCRVNGVNERQRNQQLRIRQGIRSGELTRVEAARLERREAQIGLNEALARRSGGESTRRDGAQTQHRWAGASRDIYRQKHDRQDRDR